MKKKLFIICPFSQMELFLQNKYGNEIYFITAPCAIIQWDQKGYSFAILDFIKRECIQEIYLVNDTECRFISSVIHKKQLYGLYSEKILEHIYIEHFFTHFKNSSLLLQKNKLAELNIHYQITEWMKLDSTVLQGLKHVQLKGLITSKNTHSYQEIKIQTIKTI